MGRNSGPVPNLNIFKSNGDRTFAVSQSLATGSNLPFAPTISISDFNNDGVKDILAVGASTGNVTLYAAGTALGYPPVSLLTAESARSGLETSDSVRNVLAKLDSTLGSNLARLQIGISNLRTSNEAYASARSRIMDANIAAESAALTQQQILQQIGAAVLAQANVQPRLALDLLQV